MGSNSTLVRWSGCGYLDAPQTWFFISCSGWVALPQTYPVFNLGVLLDSQLLLEEQLATMSRRAFAHFGWCGRCACSWTGRYGHTFVTSRLDYGNMLYMGLPWTSLDFVESVVLRIEHEGKNKGVAVQNIWMASTWEKWYINSGDTNVIVFRRIQVERFCLHLWAEWLFLFAVEK